MGVRMCFNASALGLESPTLPASCSMMMETLRDDEGKDIEKRQYAVPQLGVLGQGYALASYRPTEPKRREQLVQWTRTPALDALSPAVAGVIRSTSEDKAMFPFYVDTGIGRESWSWPEGSLF